MKTKATLKKSKAAFKKSKVIKKGSQKKSESGKDTINMKSSTQNKYTWLNQIQFSQGGFDLIKAENENLKESLFGRVYVLGDLIESEFSHKLEGLIDQLALPAYKQELKKQKREVLYFTSQNGPVWILLAKYKVNLSPQFTSPSLYGWGRDTIGELLAHFKAHKLDKIQIQFVGCSDELTTGVLVGIGIGSYQYKEYFSESKSDNIPHIFLVGENKESLINAHQKAFQISESVNLARHLVNMPANELNPETFVKIATQKVKWSKKSKIKVLDSAVLAKEKMGLLLAVGKGSSTSPRVLHISYRGSNNKQKPIAFVGKGITFDSGGLDIKGSQYMRLMKKDMGGAASALGVAHWVDQSQIAINCDFYLALAENSVDANSFRPGDVYTARNQMRVEIDNTDAEGRLVLADVLDYAVTQSAQNEPSHVIDFATLTGACRVALGVEIAGLFSNDDKLAHEIYQSSLSSSDLVWRLPLYEKYFSSYSSSFADIKNSGESMGGAICAALFLQKFIKNKKWAHIDMYAWADKPQGALTSSGGNGQAVQCLINYLSQLS